MVEYRITWGILPETMKKKGGGWRGVYFTFKYGHPDVTWLASTTVNAVSPVCKNLLCVNKSRLLWTKTPVKEGDCEPKFLVTDRYGPWKPPGVTLCFESLSDTRYKAEKLISSLSYESKANSPSAKHCLGKQKEKHQVFSCFHQNNQYSL